MIIVLKPDATKENVRHVVEKIESLGLKPWVSEGIERTIIGVIGKEDALRTAPIEILPGVEKVMPILKPYKLVSRESKKEGTVIKFANGLEIGAKKIQVMAGPCSVENEERLLEIARKVKSAGATILRGGAFKPRTSPYAFQGLGEEGLKYMAAAKKETGLLLISELMDVRQLDVIQKYVDIIQIGARNMQNFDLLKAVGKSRIPVLLKRGMASTVKEFLMSAEYIMSEGNFNVMLCERGIRTFEDSTRFTLDISAVPLAKNLSHLPVIVDPSHAAGHWGLVPACSKASVAAGADGLIIEVHPNPEEAFSDGAQSLLPDKFAVLMSELSRVAESVDRGM